MVFPLMDCVNSGASKGGGTPAMPEATPPEAHYAEGSTPQRAPPGEEREREMATPTTGERQSVPGGSAERIAAHRFLHRLQV